LIIRALREAALVADADATSGVVTGALRVRAPSSCAKATYSCSRRLDSRLRPLN
jgi:hypothetical protein